MLLPCSRMFHNNDNVKAYLIRPLLCGMFFCLIQIAVAKKPIGMHSSPLQVLPFLKHEIFYSCGLTLLRNLISTPALPKRALLAHKLIFMRNARMTAAMTTRHERYEAYVHNIHSIEYILLIEMTKFANYLPNRLS